MDSVYFCCRRCGWMPLEGMAKYVEIQGDAATCIVCKQDLIENPEPKEQPHD